MIWSAPSSEPPSPGEAGLLQGSGKPAAHEPTVSVVIVDDHPVVLQGTRAMLGVVAGIEILGLATNGSQAIELATTLRPDVLVLDIRLPDISGLEVARSLRDALPELGILAFTAYDDPAYVDAMVALGVRGYLPKGASIDELAGAVRTVAGGGTWLVTAAPRDDPARQFNLSARERQILELIVAGRRNAEIASDLGLALKTVEHHISRLFDKLGVRSRVEAAQLATRLGMSRLH